MATFEGIHFYYAGFWQKMSTNKLTRKFDTEYFTVSCKAKSIFVTVDTEVSVGVGKFVTDSSSDLNLCVVCPIVHYQRISIIYSYI